jgi:hypothetical protein
MISQRLRLGVSIWQQTQFMTLYRLFLGRVVDLEILSKEADTTRLVAQFMTILSGISLLLALPVLLAMGGVGAEEAWTPEHFFIATTLFVVGGVSVMSWDAALPDRLDVLVLATLPVRMSTLFAAKVLALFSAPALAVVSLNAFTGLLWPLLFMSRGHRFLHAMRAWPAYWITMIGAAVSIFCSLLVLRALLQNILPRQLFLRLSAIVQAVVLCGLLCLFFLEPSLASVNALTAPENQRVLAWLPAYWFLGMFQQLNGSMEPQFVWLAQRAYWVLGASLIASAAMVMLSYLRMLPKIVEQPDIVPASRSFALPFWMGNAFHQAILLFSVRTLLRSRQHRMILSFYVGIGLAIVVGYGMTAAGKASNGTAIPVTWLLASVLLVVLPVLALRVVAAMPISLQANWIMQMTQVRPGRSYRRAVRLSWLMMTVLPAVLLVGAVFLRRFTSGPAWMHLTLLLVLGLLTVELCLISFAKVPFACSYMPGKANVHVLFWTLPPVIAIVRQELGFENKMFLRPGLFAGFVGLLLVISAGVALATEIKSRRSGGLLFEERLDDELVTLGL